MNLPGSEQAVIDSNKLHESCLSPVHRRGVRVTLPQIRNLLFTVYYRRIEDLMPELEMLSVVALIEDLPEKNRRPGRVGTIVENLAPGVYEVEFSADDGGTYASAAVKAHLLMRLYHEPKPNAAWKMKGPRRSYAPTPTSSGTPASFFFLRNGIIALNSAPTRSIG